MTRTLNLPDFPGWHLLGSFPEGDPDGVGSWLLHHGGEALLLEVPPGLTVREVEVALGLLDCQLNYVTASHGHGDHLDGLVWGRLMRGFPNTLQFIHPWRVEPDRLLYLGGEPLYLIGAPKHSPSDVVTVFRGVAHTGDIELEMLESVNEEVSPRRKRESMDWLREFEERQDYRVHAIVSAHLNDVRQDVCWVDLFNYESEEGKEGTNG